MRGRRSVALGGRVPVGARHGVYGYDYDKGLKERWENAREGAVVKRIFRLFLCGWSMYRIAKLLNEEKILTKTGKRFTGGTIRDILLNTSYKGVDYYGKTMWAVGKDGKRRRVEAPRENWVVITGYSPVIVSEEVFERAGERLESIQERVRGRTERKYMLTGIALCGFCGNWMSSNGGPDGKRYYRCNSRHAKYVRGEETDCRARGIPVDWLDDTVWKVVVAMVRDPSGIIEDLELNFRTGGGEVGKEVEGLRLEVRKVEDEEERLLVLYRRGTVRLELLEGEMGRMTECLSRLRSRLAALEEQQKQEENAGLAGERIREYCERVAVGLDELDSDGKRELMFRLGVKVKAVKGDVMVVAEIDPGFVVNEATT